MAQRSASSDRAYSVGEEIAHSVSHGLGLLLAIAAIPFLVACATEPGATAGIVGASVFAITLFMVYLTSTLYHALPIGRAKRTLRVFDHAAIFLLIAGTYTPFTLGVLRGPWGWTLFGLVWAVCITGVILKTAGSGVHRPRISIVLYLTAGWLALIAAKPMITLVPAWGLAWLLAGGVAYTGGVLFYRAKTMPYAHLAWHVCVMAGTACHFVAVARYSA
ncbi:MAG: hemolysin III family protein [Planctomycetes bacterium]|nr:hemolysin III family protein [Planctomycetota bacterium]